MYFALFPDMCKHLFANIHNMFTVVSKFYSALTCSFPYCNYKFLLCRSAKPTMTELLMGYNVVYLLFLYNYFKCR